MLAYGGDVRRLLIAFACLPFLVVACGDDEPSIDPEADADLIEDALLTIDDLPEGFQEEEPDDDSDDDNECNEEILDVDQDDLEASQSAESEQVQFDDPATSIRAEITAFRDTDLAEQVLNAIDDDEYVDCLEEGIVEELAEEEEDGEVLGVESVSSPVDDARAIEVTFDIRGTAVTSQQHAVLVDRFGITLQYTAVEGDVDDDLVEELIDTMIDRLELDED